MKKYLSIILIASICVSSNSQAAEESLVGTLCKIFIESFMRAAGKVVGQRVIGNFVNYSFDNVSAMLKTTYEIAGDTHQDALRAIKRQRRLFAGSGAAMVGGCLSALLLHKKCGTIAKYANVVKYGTIGCGVVSLSGLCSCIFLLNRVPIFRAASEREKYAFYQAGGADPFEILIGTPHSPVLI